MSAKIPVYSDENNLHHVSIFTEESDGTFKRTYSEPLRQVRNHIQGISINQGDIISPKFDKNERTWESPTVSFHYGKPQSVYYFLRKNIARNKFYVFTKPNLSGRIIQFSLHELKLKPGTSQKILTILKEKYIEAIDLWSQEQHMHQTGGEKAVGGGINARKVRLMQKKKRALQKLKESHKSAGDLQSRAQLFVSYSNLKLANEPEFGVFPENTKKPDEPSKTSEKKKKEKTVYNRMMFLID
jgi:hypothetical protein